MNIWHSFRAVRQRTTIAAAFLLLVSAIPVHAQNTPASPPAAGAERETIQFEGIRIVFPKGEADVVELLKPALLKFREERQKVVEAEAKDIAGGLSGTEMREKVRQLAKAFTARDWVSQGFDARWAAQTETMRKIAKAWQSWSGDISELQLWRGRELVQFQTRPDGGDDENDFTYRFPQVSFGKNGARFALHPDFLASLVGLDIMLKLNREIKPLRVDLPLLYKPGASPEEIAKYGKTFLAEVPVFIHREYGRGFGLADALPRWTFENMFLGEIEAVFVDRRTAEETALADGLARLLLFAQALKQDGEQKVAANFNKLFPFSTEPLGAYDPAATLASVEKLDPLAPVARAKVSERIFARNLIALTLVEIAQKDDTQAPILHKFKKAGVVIPVGGFTMDSFIAAVDTAYGEKGFFRRAVAAKKAATLEQMRQSLETEKEKTKKAGESLAAAAPDVSAAIPGRESAKFDGLTITFPPALKGAIEIVGPEYAKVIKKARGEIEKVTRKEPGPAVTKAPSADAEALRAYGLEPDNELLRDFVALIDALQDGTQFARWIVSGDQMQIWVKEDMVDFLKGGGKIPDFTLADDGQTVNWALGFALSSKSLDLQKMAASPAEARAEIAQEFEAIPRPNYPIILKRASLPANLDDARAIATLIRADEGKALGIIRAAIETPGDVSRAFASLIPKSQQATRWFLLAHEVSEAAIISTVIRSADRRWFCDGMANWIALRDVDRRFGLGKGAEVFANSYDAAELRKAAAKVDLLAWPTVEDVKNGSRPEVGNSLAYYYFATLVMEKACEGQGADFVKKWLDEIRKTPLNRANTGTVLTAYQKLTGKDLKSMIGEVVK
jgi:hypothetical protein